MPMIPCIWTLARDCSMLQNLKSKSVLKAIFHVRIALFCGILYYQGKRD